MNTYSLEERATKSSSYRRIEVQASDNAVDALTARLPFSPNAPLRPLNIQETSRENTPPALPDNSEKTIIVEANNKTSPGDKSRETVSDNLLEVKNLFTEHSEHGIIPSKTLRDYIQQLSTKKEKQQVFAVMFVWASNKRDNRGISREYLIAAMKYEDLYDSNSKKHLDEVVKNYFKTVDDHYEINNYDGVQRVNDIIKGIQNPKPASTSTESKKSSNRGRPPGSINKAEIETVKPWLDMRAEMLNGFDVRQLRSASDWGIFGLYILTKILQVREAVEAGLVYTFLFQKYRTISVKRRTFVEKMRINKKVSLSANGAYFLTKTAEKEMKELIERSNDT